MCAKFVWEKKEGLLHLSFLPPLIFLKGSFSFKRIASWGRNAFFNYGRVVVEKK